MRNGVGCFSLVNLRDRAIHLLSGVDPVGIRLGLDDWMMMMIIIIMMLMIIMLVMMMMMI